MASTTRRDLKKELEDEIKPWTGSTTFTTPQASRVKGSMFSPIAITSSPEEVEISTRTVRGVARYESALPRTAYTPPKLQLHPFFQPQRARTLPPHTSVPASQRPRLVAHYSSTEASSSTSQSQSQSQDTQSTFDHDLRDKGKGKQKASSTYYESAPPGWAEDVIDQIAEDLSKTNISGRVPLKNRSTIPAPGPGPGPVSAKPAFTRAAQTRPNAPLSIKGKSPQAVSAPTLPFFHYADLPHPPKIAYTTSPSEADDLVSCLRGDVYGFDLEWPPSGKYTSLDEKTGVTKVEWVGRTWDNESRKYRFKPGRTALIQICDKDLIVLVHLKDAEDLPQSVIDLVQDQSKYKLGVQIAGDGRKLLSDFPTQLKRAASLLELTWLARKVDGEAIGPGNTLISLARQTERYLSKTLRKESRVRGGNWGSALSQEQVDYAANDVYASYLIFETLLTLAKQRSIDLDLPTFCSNLGDVERSATPNGATLARRSSGSSGPSPAQHRTLEAFIAGQGTEEISKQMGIKRTTVQGYLAAGLERVHDDVLSDADKRRFLNDVKDAYWVMRNHRTTIERITADLKDGDTELGVFERGAAAAP